MNNRRKLFAAFGACVFALVALASYQIWSGYQDALSDAETATRNYALISEARLDATLRRSDAILQEWVRVLPADALRRPSPARYARDIDATLQAQLNNFPELGGIRIFDADGNLRYTTDSVTVARTNIADRSHFARLRDDPQADLVFSEVIVSRTRAQHTMAMARALRDSQGAFLGIVSATIDVNHFESLFRSLDIGRQGMLSIYRADNAALVARWPSGEPNKKLPLDSPGYAAIARGEKTATVYFLSSTDGVTRVYSIQALTNYPFYVTAGLGRGDVLAGWAMRAQIVGFSVLLFAVILLWLTRRLWRTEDGRDRLAAIVDNSNDSIVGRGRDGTITSWNAGAERLYGYSAAEMIGTRSTRLVPNDRRHEFAEIFAPILEGVEVAEFETVRLTKSGCPIDVSLRMSAIKDQSGKIVGTSTVSRDITARKKSEQIRAQLAAIVESANDAIMARTLDGKVMVWNTAAERMYGYTAAELIGRDLPEDFIPPEEMQKREYVRQQLREGKSPPPYECIRIGKGGRRVHVQLSVAVIHNEAGEIVWSAGIHRDTSERKQLELERNWLATIIEHSNDSIVSRGLDGRIISWNRGAERLYGYSAAEMIGSNTVRLIPAGHQHEFTQLFNTVMEGGQVAEQEAVRITKSGRHIDVSLQKSAIRDMSGKIVGTSSVTRDISARKKSEQIRAQLAAIVESAQDPIIGRAPDGAVVAWNPAAERLYGYTAAELIGCSLLPDFVPPEEHQKILGVKRQLKEGKSPLPYESVRVAKDGRRVNVQISPSAVRDDSGELIFTAGIHRDVSERRRMEAERDRLAAIVENSNDAIIGRTLDGTITSWNAAAVRMFGYTASEAIGQPIVTLAFGSLHATRFAANNDRLRRGETVPPIETMRRSKDGRKIAVVSSVSPIRNEAGEVVGASNILRDVSELKQAAVQVRLATSVFDHAAEAIIITDLEHRVISVNDAFTRITGYTAGEIIGKIPRRLLSHGQSDESYAEMWAAVAAAGNWHGELASTRKNGELYYRSLSLSIVRDEQGVVSHYCGIFADITARKVAENNLGHLNAELEQRVVARTGELLEAKNAAEHANKAKSQFLTRMSHELRTPLNSILGYAQILNQCDADASIGSERQSIQAITHAGWYLLRIITDLLDLAAIEGNKIEMYMEDVGLHAVLAECLVTLEPMAGAGAVTINVAPGCRNASVSADRFRLKQVLLNVLTNAVKYNRRGGSVKIDCERVRPDRWRIAVTDTGSGIPAEDLQGLFKPFSRFHERAYHIEGIGIGLTIAKGLLELMDGTIGVKSRRGRGSTFWIELKQGAEAAAVVPALNSPYRGVHEAIKNFTMLYIEDSPSHVGLMQRIVGAMDNIDMLTAHTAVLGLELARAHRPDLILCDISLPGMDGYELLQHLLSDESTRRIPVLAISANAMPNEVEKGLRAGFRHYLTKPLDVARFRATVFELLEEQLAERG